MNKKTLYESIMRQVSIEVKKALNESIIDDTDEYTGIWGNEDMDNEAEPDGSIIVKMARFTYGGRETEDTRWKMEMLEDFIDYWKVKATCIYTEWRRYKLGDEVEFTIDKDGISVWDLDTVLRQALRDNDF